MTRESGDDAHLRRAEAARDARDRAAVVGRVEQLGRLDHRLLGLREPAQDRLLDDRRRFGRAAEVEEARQPAAAAPAVGHGRRRRAPLADPAALERLVDAERADVHESAPTYGWNRTARSPRRSARSQTSQLSVMFVRDTRIAPRV